MNSKFHKEIEVKAKITNIDTLKKALEKKGCVFTEEVVQVDTNFINKESTFPHVTPGCQALRIREEGDKIILTFKESVSNELDKIEREIEISNKEQMEDIIKLIGFLPGVKIVKKRIKTEYKGYEICLDSVEELGDFIEIEKLTSEEDAQKVQEELMSILETFGVKRSERVLNGYDVLLHNSRN